MKSVLQIIKPVSFIMSKFAFVKKLWASGLENYIRILFQIALFLS